MVLLHRARGHGPRLFLLGERDETGPVVESLGGRHVETASGLPLRKLDRVERTAAA